MYQPRISDENIRRLYQLRIHVQRPMTYVLDEILNEYFVLHALHIEMEPQKKLQKL
jgi:hypothetical protein